MVVLTNGTLLRRHEAMLRRWSSERLHLQISVDGLADRHDQVRGPGAFDRLKKELDWLRAAGVPFTLSLCVMQNNVRDLPGLADWAAEVGAANVHFMWYFVRGRGGQEGWASVDEIFAPLRQAALRAEAAGIGLDNIDALKGQVFAPAGTVHDGTSAGWDSLAIGPDGKLYPSPALVGVDALATEITGDLAAAWRGSAVLERIRRVTAAGLTSPLRFILGGGDLDHCYTHAGRFIGCDPYEPLHNRTALWLIARAASRQPDDGPPRLRLKMGDVLESCGPHGPVATMHSNCLLAVAHVDGHTAVRQFYAAAAANPCADIRNPVHYPEALIEHIPDEARVRSYGCGSPVIDANPRPGDVVVDLGSGTGVECFIAVRLVGAGGRVIGVDMLDIMLDMVRRGAERVQQRLGYRNVEFRKGYLEALPLEDQSADLVLSNCVLNLATNKRLGLRRDPPRAEAGGAAGDFGRRLRDGAGRRDPQRRILAWRVHRRGVDATRSVRPPGRSGLRRRLRAEAIPLSHRARTPLLLADVRGDETRCVGNQDGHVSRPGSRAGHRLRSVAASRGDVPNRGWQPDGGAGDLFEFDENGDVTNMAVEPCLSCAAPPETRTGPEPGLVQLAAPSERHTADCMVCGAPLTYLESERLIECSYCGRSLSANAVCANGHFVCDACHTRDELALIEQVCLTTDETDMIALMAQIRRHPSVPVHGPGHHALVPGVILSTYRNLGGELSDALIRTGIRRGAQVAGGACGFWASAARRPAWGLRSASSCKPIR